jgi:hypothetical protein
MSQKLRSTAGSFSRQRQWTGIVQLIGSDSLDRRTNLFSPSVSQPSVFKVSQITATVMKCNGIKKNRQWNFLK